jgi:hypothetical protein
MNEWVATGGPQRKLVRQQSSSIVDGSTRGVGGSHTVPERARSETLRSVPQRLLGGALRSVAGGSSMLPR